MPNKKDQSAVTHDDLANAIRFLSIDAVEKAKSGHPGLPMGMACLLYTSDAADEP